MEPPSLNAEVLKYLHKQGIEPNSSEGKEASKHFVQGAHAALTVWNNLATTMPVNIAAPMLQGFIEESEKVCDRFINANEASRN